MKEFRAGKESLPRFVPWASVPCIGVTGGRDRVPTQDQWRALRGIRKRFSGLVQLVHGDATGIDTTVAKAAERRGWYVTALPANWKRFPRAVAPMLRNGLIVRASDFLVTFGGNNGTKNCVRQAIEAGRSVVDLSGLAPRKGENVASARQYDIKRRKRRQTKPRKSGRTAW